MRVLLTGGSGFIALHVLDTLLERGHNVVFTARSQDKADKVKAQHPNVGKDKLDWLEIKDISDPKAFDNIPDEFDAVIHTASPFHFNTTDVQKDLLDPAVIGTTGILKSIKKNAPSVKHVVITSSFASIVDASKGAWPEHTYSEADWNPVTQEQALENPMLGYRASKTFAEKAAWEFLEKEKPNFTVSTMCPPLVLGPVVPGMQTLDSLNTSNQRTRDLLQGKMKDEIAPTGTFIWVDVRDLAECHVQAIEKKEAANKRFFVTAGLFSNREIADVIRKNFPEYKDKVPAESIKGGEYPEGGVFKTNNKRAEELLGRKWTAFDKSIIDTVKSLKEIGA